MKKLTTILAVFALTVSANELFAQATTSTAP